ncbi:hypothetical protein IT411_02685 [Candidatus Peregrinibacteria bacterium]|nr:hypothetical protein [Candidatus Peregrinibacteria bacterium]
MIKLKLQQFHQVQFLYELLKLPGDDLEIEKAYDSIAKHNRKKEAYISLEEYEKASLERDLELSAIKKFINILNKKGKIDGNTLTIQFSLSKKLTKKEFIKKLKLKSKLFSSWLE